MRALLLLTVLLLTGHLTAAVPTTADDAVALITAAKAAALESDSKPERIVDAAVAFSEALTWYEKQGDIDKICDLEANIFWCKKRMDVSGITAFVALKSGKAGAAQALTKVEAVATRSIEVSQAQTFFDRAQHFAEKHPDDDLQISVRFFEVAERFQGSDVSLKAQRLSLDAQQRWAKSLTSATVKQGNTERDSLFSRPAVTPGNRAAQPTAEAAKTAIASLKSLFPEDYAKTKPAARADFAAKLLTQAEGANDDPLMRFALLSEARDLAIAAKAPATVLNACDRLAASYEGIDAQAAKKAALGKLTTLPVTAHLLKLLDTPADPEANLAAGRWFATDGDEFAVALPLLAKGSDPAIAKAATMETANPAGTTEQNAMGDQWYELGRKTSTLKEVAWRRAQHWYRLALPGLKGISATVIDKRLAEITAYLPLGPDTDWDNLTVAQWDKVKAPVFSVEAAVDRNSTGLRLVPGIRYRVIPHPTDTWHLSANRGINLDTTAKGDRHGRRSVGSMACAVGNGSEQEPGIITGDGLLYLFANAPRGKIAAHKGAIRVKVMQLADD